MHFEGKVIEKTGDLTYHIQDGWVVTCKLQPGETAPWSFAASDVEITDGGYALLTHATFRIKDVPVCIYAYHAVAGKTAAPDRFSLSVLFVFRSGRLQPGNALFPQPLT